MHVALVTPFPSSPHAIPGGVAGVAKYLADALVQLGARVSVIVPQVERLPAKMVSWANYPVYSTGGGWIGSLLPGRICSVLFTRARVHRLLRELKPDIAHFQGLCDLSLDSGVPSVVTIHGITELDIAHEGRRPTRLLKLWLEQLIEVRARSRVSNVVMISRYGRRILTGRIEPKLEWLIPNPIAPEYFGVDRRPEASTLFACSRIVPLKNIEGLIRAFSDLGPAFPDLVLRIGGDGAVAYMEHCRSLVHSLGLQGRVVFLGHLSTEGVRSELARATCLVVSSLQENSPLAIAEAMAAGVPVAATPVGGIPEMIEEGKTGTLAQDVSPPGIASAVRRLLACDLESMSSRAKHAARDRHWPAAVAEAHLAAYREVLG